MEYERKQVQISAFIAEETKLALDRYVEATGMKKNRVIEDALKHHLAAVDEIPAKYIIDPHMVVSWDTWEMMWEMIETEREPSPSLVKAWKDYYDDARDGFQKFEERIFAARAAAEGKTLSGADVIEDDDCETSDDGD
jgi:hypothetical protein